MNVEERMKKYEVLGEESLLDLCIKDFQEHLGLITREMKYKEVGNVINNFFQR